MDLHAELLARAGAARPVRVGLVGAGKFGAMFLAQVPTTPGLAVGAIADLEPGRARRSCRRVGWSEERIAASAFVEDGRALAARDDVDVVVEATGDPAAGLRHARAALAAGKHVVMANVEADVLAGALLAEEARRAGLVYGMAYGDQPALAAELVAWARCCGFEVVAAGKGTKYLPAYHAATPETVWGHYGLDPEEARAGGMNPRMFTSFLDGTKSSIEMAALANATGLAPPPDGLSFPPCGRDELAERLRPAAEGGVLHRRGEVAAVSSLRRDGSPVAGDLRWGVYVVFEAPGDYSAACFRHYGIDTDSGGRVAALYRPVHLVGLELNVSVLSAALLGRATGRAERFAGDAVAVAKRDLAAGERLDGEGGHTVWGKLLPAAASLARGALPIGLARDTVTRRAIGAGACLARSDVVLDESGDAVATRRAMERRFAPALRSAAEPAAARSRSGGPA